MNHTRYITQKSTSAANRQGSLWTDVSRKQLIRIVENLIYSFLVSHRIFRSPVKKAATKNRIFHTCSKLMYSNIIVKIYLNHSNPLVAAYLNHSHQSVVHRSSDSGQIVVRQSGYTKMVSYISIPYGFLKHVPQRYPRPPN